MSKKEKWLRFCAEGLDEIEAARLAGYKYPEAAAKRNIKYFKAKSKDSDEQIADMEEVMEFFTQVMRGETGEANLKTAERTKAAEFIVKRYESLGDKNEGGDINVYFDIPRPSK